MTHKNETAAHEVLTGPAGLFFFSSVAILVLAMAVRLFHIWL